MRKPTRKVLGVVIGVPAFAAAGLAVYAWASSAATFARHEKEIEGDVETLRKGDRRQPVLYGAGISGNGWDFFAQAMKELQKSPKFDDEGRLQEEQDGEWTDLRAATPADLDKIFDGLIPPVKLLREAFSRTEFDPPVNYEVLFGPDLVWDFSVSRVTSALAAWARRLHGRGRDAEALDVLLLALGAAHASARHQALFCQRMMGSCERELLGALRMMLESHALGAGELLDASRRLGKLLDGRPSIMEGLRVEMVRTRRTYLLLRSGPIDGQPDLELDENRRLLCWRYCFSRRLMITSALEAWTATTRRHLELDRLPVHRRAMAAVEIDRDAQAVPNPMLWKFNPIQHEQFARDTRVLSDLTLARLALALARFEVENGRAAATLSDLVPDQLPSIAPDPNTGTPFVYHDGRLQPAPEPDAADIPRGEVRPVWTVHRKLP